MARRCRLLISELQLLQPVGEFGSPLMLIGEPVVECPTMSTNGIDVQAVEYSLVGKRLAVCKAVEQRNHLVIYTVHDEGRRCVGSNLLLYAVTVYHGLRGVLAEKAFH